jgi:hypothetical protein
MTCDDFLPALETGGYFRRAAAKRHAAACPACARSLAAWEALKRELAAAPALTPRERDLWTAAAGTAAGRPRVRRLRRAVDFAIAASLLGLATYLFLHSRKPDGNTEAPPRASSTPVVIVTAVSPASVAIELSPLEQRLARLEAELATLSQRAELADLRRQAATLLDEYRQW